MTHTTTYRQKDNGWQIIVSYKDGSKWKQKSKQGFPSKRDAKAYEATLLKQIKNRPQPVDQAMADITLEKFCKIYLKGRPELTYSTQRHYINAVKSLQDVSKKAVHTITYLDIQNAVSGWNTKQGTQSLYRTKLNVLFKAAVRPYRLITDNPMDDITIAKDRNKKEKRVLTAEEIQKVLSTNELALHVLYYTGLRKGELLALTWADINWKDNTLTVNKQFGRGHNGKWENIPTKSTNGFREIPLPAVLIRELKHYHDTMPMDINRHLFPMKHTTYIRMQKILRKISADLTPHCLRHTYATNLLAKGVDVQTVAALLGDNAQTVIRTYLHYSDEMRKAAADSIQKIFAQNF